MLQSGSENSFCSTVLYISFNRFDEYPFLKGPQGGVVGRVVLEGPLAENTTQLPSPDLRNSKESPRSVLAKTGAEMNYHVQRHISGNPKQGTPRIS